mmetsp:Transcript_2727/g.9147  ORF Transcript_2727/g.9147 Transcript_2727/m.9147 type:complete len:390 (-) Transcript_2727:71-1240(-)
MDCPMEEIDLQANRDAGVIETESRSNLQTEKVTGKEGNALRNTAFVKLEEVDEVKIVVQDSCKSTKLKDQEQHEQSVWQKISNIDPQIWWALIGILLFIGLGAICGTQIYETIIEAKDWFVNEIPISIIWYSVMFSLSSAVMLPYGPFCISVGYIYGFWFGLIVQTIAIFTSSALIYYIGRIGFKSRVDQYMQKYIIWKAMMAGIEKSTYEAAKINILLCFVPMPYGVHAFLFALSTCPFVPFVISFEIGMIGHTTLNLAIGDALAQATSEGTDLYTLIGAICGVTAMIFTIWYGGVLTQKMMDTYIQEGGEADGTLLHNASMHGSATEVQVVNSSSEGSSTCHENTSSDSSIDLEQNILIAEVVEEGDMEGGDGKADEEDEKKGLTEG